MKYYATVNQKVFPIHFIPAYDVKIKYHTYRIPFQNISRSKASSHNLNGYQETLEVLVSRTSYYECWNMKLYKTKHVFAVFKHFDLGNVCINMILNEIHNTHIVIIDA